jgi:hypothetical protein
MFQTKFVDEIKTLLYLRPFIYLVFFFWKFYRLGDNVGKVCRAGQAIDDNMAHAHWMLDT